MELQTAINTGYSLLALAGVAWGIFRGKKQDADSRIDERITIKVGVTLSEIKTTLQNIQDRMPSRDTQIQDSARIHELERWRAEVVLLHAEILGRLRVVENSCARQGHVDAGGR